MFFHHVVRLLVLVITCLLPASVLQANHLFLSPPEGSTSIYTYVADPLAFFRSYAAGASTVAVLGTPDGSKFYIVSSSAAGTVLTVNSEFTAEVAPPLDLGAATAATLTPDGKKLLVLSGSLKIVDTQTNTEVPHNLMLGSLLDVAVSHDSRRAYVVNTSFQLFGVDLTNLTVIGSPLTLQGSPTNVAVGPNGAVYVSATNRVYEVNGRTLAIRSEISASGRLGKITFHPNGTRAYVLNDQLFMGPPITAIDLQTRAVVGSVSNFNVVFDRMVIGGSDRMLAFSRHAGRIYEFPLSTLIIKEALFEPSTSFAGVTAMAATNEHPSPRHLFIATSSELIRIDLATNQIHQQRASVLLPPQSMSYFGKAQTGTPASYQQYNGVQVVPPGTHSIPLVLRVIDTGGTPLANVTVTFQSASTGLTLESTTVSTNAHGYAQTYAIVSATTGSLQVTASVPGLANASFLINIGSAGDDIPAAYVPRAFSGNGQVLRRSTTSSVPLVVLVRDANGNLAPNVRVTWSVTSGHAFIMSDQVVLTDQNGKAQASVGGAIHVPGPQPFTQAKITATTTNLSGTTTYGSTDFFVTTLADPSSGGVASFNAHIVNPVSDGVSEVRVRGKVGQVLTEAIQVRVTTAFDGPIPIPNVGVEVEVIGSGPTAACTGGYILTDASGIGTCNLALGGKPGEALIFVRVAGEYSFSSIPLTVSPGDPAQVRIIQGNNQAGAPGQRLPVPLVAEVTDASGNTLGGQQVIWEVVTPTGVGLADIISTSDANGRVSAFAVLGTTPGEAQVRVRIGSASATFTLTVVVAAGNLQKISGDNQSAIINAQFGQPLIVRAVDQDGRGLPNTDIDFAVTQGLGFLSNPRPRTDPDGRVTVTVTAGNTPGPVTVRASLGNLNVTFNLTVIPPGPVITGMSFYNAAGFHRGAAPGALVRIVGSGLAPGLSEGSILANGNGIGPWPHKLRGVSVRFGSHWAPVHSVSKSGGEEFITVQVPFEVTPGTVAVTVFVDEGSTTVDAQVAEFHPGIFQTWHQSDQPHAVILRPDGSYVSPLNPAKRGELLRVFVTGLGAVSPNAGTGRVGTGGQMLIAPVIVGVNNEGVRVVSAEYAENMTGVYLVTFELPGNAASGAFRPFAIAVDTPGGFVFGNPSAIAAIE